MRIMNTSIHLLTFLNFVFFVSSCCYADENTKMASVPAAGGDIVQIVIADPCDPVQKSCAADVQRIFSTVTGNTVVINTTQSEGRCLFIGCTPKGIDVSAKLAKLGEDGIYLNISPKAVICTGRTPQGVYNAVQELLYQIGYRNIWPGSYGECMPESNKIDLSKDMDIAHDPSFLLRGGHSVQVEARPGQKPIHINTEHWVDWAARNHINRYKASYPDTWDYGTVRGGGWREVTGHTSQAIFLPSEEFGKSRPEEWYALFNGKRVARHPITGTAAEPCVSNPDFIAFVTKTICDYFTKFPDAKRYMICAADEPSYWCTCERCRAWDPNQFEWNWTPYGPHEELQPRHWHMADRWLRFVNIVADRIDKKFPGKLIGMYSYSGTGYAPVEVVPAKNVTVEVCIPDLCRKHSLLDNNCPQNVECLQRFQSWQKLSSKIAIYSYLEYEQWEIPVAFFHTASDLYRSLSNLGVAYISDEIDSTPHASPVYLGLWGRLLWDVNSNPDTYVSDFCKIAYGQAGPEMEQFWRYQESVMQNSNVVHRGHNDIERFTPEVLKNSYEFLQTALSKKLTNDQIARVQRAKMSVLMAEFYTAKTIADKNIKAWSQAYRCKKEIFQIANKYGFAINLASWNALGGDENFESKTPGNGDQYEIPIPAIDGEMLLALPDNWLFRKDPNDQGEDDKWYSKATSLDEYKSISVSKFWNDQWAGSYIGTAWYVTTVVIPKTKAKHVWLLFGAVDETWKVWIDGEYMGNSKGAPAQIWDMPAAVEITGKYIPEQKVRIAVCVHNQAGPGGVWKPVTITTSNAGEN